VIAKIAKADSVRDTDPHAAYEAYVEVLDEARPHKIKGDQLRNSLAEAETSRDSLYPRVREKVRAEQLGAKRRAEEDAQRLAAERNRIAEAERRRLAAEEEKRVAAEKQRAAEQLRKKMAAAYRNVPPSAYDALNVAKKLNAKMEIGMRYADYSSAVGDAWGEIKVFAESADGKKIPEFGALLTKSIVDYKLAMEIWQNKIEFPNLYGSKSCVEKEVDVLQQLCWSRAGQWIELAESLLDSDKTELKLQEVVEFLAKEEDLDARWKEIENKVLRRES
jgi:hypothetical protein